MADEDEEGVSAEQIRAEEEALRRAWQAKRLLDEPMIVEAFATIEGRLTTAWRTSLADDVEGREEAHRTLRCLDLFKNELTVVLNAGKVAETDQRNRRQEAVAKELEAEWDPNE